jgi:hypothetical protein
VSTRPSQTAFARVDKLRRSRERSSAARVVWLVAPLLLGVAAAFVARPALLWFLSAPEKDFVPSLAGLGLRLGLLACGICVFRGHTLALRGLDRTVLDPHPADPKALVPVLQARLLRETWPLATASALLLLPLLGRDGGATAALLAAILVFEGWLCGAGLSLLMPFAGVWVARSRGLRRLLEATSGGQPPMQVALIYAPGFGLAACGGALFLAMKGFDSVLSGQLTGWVLLLAPLPLAVVFTLLARRAAGTLWYAASEVTAEIDAAWARLVDPEEARRVQGEWIVRLLPAGIRIHTLRSLRQSWRSLRGWSSGAWALGLLAGLAGWSTDPWAAHQAVYLATAAIGLLSGLAIRMEQDDPAWLQEALALPPGRRLVGRAVATYFALQGAVLPTAAAVAIRQGALGLGVLVILEVFVAIAACFASLASPLRGRAWFIHVPSVLFAWLVVLRSWS